MRLDLKLVETGDFPSRTRAQAAIKAGLVRIDGVVETRVSAPVDPGAKIDVAGDVHPYVSRGGVKLAAGLAEFRLDPSGLICLDLGASTGGFTDVLLRKGASRVYAVDVGSGQLHAAIAADPRVVSLEKTPASALGAALIADPIESIVCDVSFISLRKALPPALALAAPNAWLVALVKPQFEVGRAALGKGGIVKPGAAFHEDVVAGIADWIDTTPGWRALGVMESPIAGGDGNREFLIGAQKSS
jgi:23S rRNA (cytidine1920-2'-O)/16S rRNA (cytidine1409-2'-O)-methyltransferase